MTPFGVLAARAAVLDRPNIDTDQIIPARFLRQPRNVGYGQFLFQDLPDVRATLPGAEILIAGANFGCGSSREGAVYALADAGIRCVIAPSFGDIFAGNAAQNGLLTIALPEGALASLQDAARSGTVVVDLPAQTVVAPELFVPFEIDPFRKRCLIEGLDDIGLTLTHADSILGWEAADIARREWARPAR